MMLIHWNWSFSIASDPKNFEPSMSDCPTDEKRGLTIIQVMDDHDLVLKPMVTLGTLILGNLHTYIYIYTHTFKHSEKKKLIFHTTSACIYLNVVTVPDWPLYFFLLTLHFVPLYPVLIHTKNINSLDGLEGVVEILIDIDTVDG